ncbi:hypothetical protein [Candidatus Uabimicrobium amorphum]|nr:hypothetical protein [Candidatus Uabimicrobium amorphum]
MSINPKQGQQIRQLIEKLQLTLRERLLEELWDDKDCLEEAIEHPESYSYKFQTYKEQYLDKLSDLQRIWNELVTLEKTRYRNK